MLLCASASHQANDPLAWLVFSILLSLNLHSLLNTSIRIRLEFQFQWCTPTLRFDFSLTEFTQFKGEHLMWLLLLTYFIFPHKRRNLFRGNRQNLILINLEIYILTRKKGLLYYGFFPKKFWIYISIYYYFNFSCTIFGS